MVTNGTDSDHRVFWLVLADQFTKRGHICDRVRETAVAIIDDDRDIAMHAALGMTPADLSNRRKTLAALRTNLVWATEDEQATEDAGETARC